MRYFALATDYDNTIAIKGKVEARTVQTLKRLRDSGRRLILVTGRELEDLKSVSPDLNLFDLVVAENGGLMYEPATHTETLLAPVIDDAFLAALRKAKVQPLAAGKTIIATEKPNELKALEVIRDMGLEMQVIFNKESVMILPAGVNKASGLLTALATVGISPHNVVAVGDAENDHALLQSCELSVAVANAVPSLKEQADYVTRGVSGAGVRELARALLKDDLRNLDKRMGRWRFVVGTDAKGNEVALPSHAVNVLITGSSGGGKSSLAKVLLERLADQHYQFCVVDPEGDYEGFEEGVVLGDSNRLPTVSEAMQVLRDPAQNAVLNLVGVALSERPSFFLELLTAIQEQRARIGRPHWLFLDEAQYLLPKDHAPASLALPQSLQDVVYITHKPELMLTEALASVDIAFAVAEAPGKALAPLIKAKKASELPEGMKDLATGEAVLWTGSRRVTRFSIAPTRLMHSRHRRKYETGDLEPELAFYFTGPDAKLNLRAQNLSLFGQIADGVDDEAWTYHLRRHDYSNWFRDVIKDKDLAKETAGIEKKRGLSPAESRRLVREAIAARYAVPDKPAAGSPFAKEATS